MLNECLYQAIINLGIGKKDRVRNEKEFFRGVPYTIDEKSGTFFPIMAIYVVQVRAGDEGKALKLLESEFIFPGKFFLLEKEVEERRQGRSTVLRKLFFPGYLFYESDERIDPLFMRSIFRNDLIFGFLRDEAQNPLSLNSQDQELISNRIRQYGENFLARFDVSFEEGGRAHIINGPFFGFDGSVVKVDRRKKRLALQLDSCEHLNLLWVGYHSVSQS